MARRGITVLGLLLLLIALVVAGIFLMRYLRGRPTSPAETQRSLVVSDDEGVSHRYRISRLINWI